MTAYNPRIKGTESSRSSMSSANPLGDIESIEGEVPVDVEQELSKRMKHEKDHSDDEGNISGGSPGLKRKNRPFHMQMSDDSSDDEFPVSQTRGRSTSQLSNRRPKEVDTKLRDVR
mmetsp:Transcript_26579/g.40572  ORF Transcript_26579/g.40572 Transcript_26579/m.40572 type:complete len:116 (-) Transcript_26579:760-1107(-)